MSEAFKKIWLSPFMEWEDVEKQTDMDVAYIRADLVDEVVKALERALNSHGVMLMSDPPQDAWKARGVEWQARAALKNLED